MIAEPQSHPGYLNLMRKVSLSGAMIECIRLQWEREKDVEKGREDVEECCITISDCSRVSI